MLYLITSTIISIYFFGVMLSPFPHWKTYFKLWANVLFNRTSLIPLSTRFHQAILLLCYAIKASVFGYLWQLDKIIYQAYLKQEIQPVFIIGSPRSGTTFLHRTIALDEENFFAIRHIQWRYPFITIQKLISLLKLEKWIERMNYWGTNESGVEAAKMHNNTLMDYEEDGIFFEECFLFHFFTLLRFPYPSLVHYFDDLEHLRQKDQKLLMQTHREVIQKIMYLRGSDKIYLSKEVTSNTKLKILIAMYPTARFIVNLRDSTEFMSSLLKLIQLSTASKTGVDIFMEDSPFKSSIIQRMQTECSILSDFIARKSDENKPAEPLRHCVTYSHLKDHPMRTIEYLYENLGLKMSPTFLEKLQLIQLQQCHRKESYNYKKEQIEGFDKFDELVATYSNGYNTVV